MQLRAYAPGIALSAALLLTGCTGGSGSDSGDGGSKSGSSDSGAEPAAPGKYRALPDPCRSVDRGTLASLLPGTSKLDKEQKERVFEGEATVTHATDRQAGCRWKSESEGGESTHRLHVDFERVVSYDTTVSDEARAAEVYAKKELAADLPPPADPRKDESATIAPEATGTGTESGAAEDGKADDDGEGGAEEDGTAGSPESSDPSASATESPAEGLEPRALEDLGDDAFVDDELVEPGTASQRRTVTVVFRTSNVLVTVAYDKQPAPGSKPPSSKNMQENAQGLARKLAELFDE